MSAAHSELSRAKTMNFNVEYSYIIHAHETLLGTSIALQSAPPSHTWAALFIPFNFRVAAGIMAMAKVYPRDQDNKRTPKRHFVVYVGDEMKRFVLPTSYLKNPSFQQLLKESAEIYGFQNQKGIVLPCDESTFLRVIENTGT